jgi:HK97 family phage portal protein
MGALSELRSRVAAMIGGETRAVTPMSLLGLLGSTSLATEAVTVRTAENVATVLACIQAITTAVSTLPSYVYLRQGVDRTEVFDHPLSRLIRRGPNGYQTWGDFLESLLADALLQGNGLAHVIRDGGGVASLRFIPWRWVQVTLLPSGRLAYDVVEGGAMPGAVGARYRLLQSEVIHLRDRSDDGLIGRSRLSRSADTFNAAMTTNKAAAAFLANGSKLSGILETPETIEGEPLQRLSEQFAQGFSGVENQGRTLILEGGMTFKTIMASPEDSELLASR